MAEWWPPAGLVCAGVLFGEPVCFPFLSSFKWHEQERRLSSEIQVPPGHFVFISPAPKGKGECNPLSQTVVLKLERVSESPGSLMKSDCGPHPRVPAFLTGLEILPGLYLGTMLGNPWSEALILTC